MFNFYAFVEIIKLLIVLRENVKVFIMKKLFVIIILCSFISVLPCYAKKIIVNDQGNRIVYSRSNWDIGTDVQEFDYSTDSTGEVQYTDEQVEAARNFKPQYIEDYKLEDLGKNIKLELVGTTWVTHNDVKQLENINNIDENVQTAYEEEGRPEDIARRNSREAADYYRVDLDRNPDELIPSGYDE